MKRQMIKEKFMRFPEGRAKAVTFSYDDGVAADGRLLQIFEKYGLKGTFNLNSALFDCPEWHGKLNEEQTYRLFGGCGQEIGLHGALHLFLTKVTLPEVVKEIADNRAYLEGKFKKIIRGMAYPYNAYNPDIEAVIEQLGVAYARTTDSTHSFALPKNMLEWHPTCHHGDPDLPKLTAEFLAAEPRDQFKTRESLLFFVWGHSYEFDDKNNWDIMERLGQELCGNPEVWFATNIQICEYLTAYENLVFSIDGERVYNPSAIPVWIELRGKTYKIESGKEVEL